MKYLKTFNLINESSIRELDFETFKEILYDLTDDYEYNYKESENGNEYYCNLKIFTFQLMDVIRSNNIDYNYSSNYNFKEDNFFNWGRFFNNDKKKFAVKDDISDLIDKINDISLSVDKAKNGLNETMKVLTIFENKLLPKFKYFNNCEFIEVRCYEGNVLIALILNKK